MLSPTRVASNAARSSTTDVAGSAAVTSGMTLTTPPSSAMNSRRVSPCGVAMETGLSIMG